jgi:hypothetical protein
VRMAAMRPEKPASATASWEIASSRSVPGMRIQASRAESSAIASPIYLRCARRLGAAAAAVVGRTSTSSGSP